MTGIQRYQQIHEVTFDHLDLISFILIFFEEKKMWSCIVLNLRFPETGLELTEKRWSENGVRSQPKTTVLHFKLLKKKSNEASYCRRKEFINLANVFNYILSIEEMFSSSLVDRLFCCCFCPVIGICQMTFQNTFSSHIISKHSVSLPFVYAICIWSVPSSSNLCGSHLVHARCKMTQGAEHWGRPS